MSKYVWNDRFVQAVLREARYAFRKDPRREEKVCDVVSVAWQMFMAAPDRATPTSVATYAVRWVRTGRQFTESERSITGPRRRGQFKPLRADFDIGDAIRWKDNPADIAEFLDFYRAWFSQLNARQQTVVEYLAAGYRTDETAELCGVTPGRISQIRREVESAWDELAV